MKILREKEGVLRGLIFALFFVGIAGCASAKFSKDGMTVEVNTFLKSYKSIAFSTTNSSANVSVDSAQSDTQLMSNAIAVLAGKVK